MNRREQRAERRELMEQFRGVLASLEKTCEIDDFDVKRSRRLSRYSLDSLCKTELCAAIEQQFGVWISLEELDDNRTFGSVVRRIQQLQYNKQLAVY